MANVITFEHPTLIQGKKDSYYGGVFDAMLDTGPVNAKDNAELTLYMRVHFYDGYNDPKIVKNGVATDGEKGPDNKPLQFKVYPWPADKFTLWKRKLIATARSFWHGKYWLQTPAGYAKLDWPRPNATHRPNVWCRFELEDSATPDGAHFSVACIYLGTSPTRNSNFRSHLLLYDSDDPLNTKRHEVGHLLGLDHPGGRNNNAAAYNDRPGYADDIMGRGKKAHLYQAAPWQKAMALITETKADDWKPAMQKVFPKSLKK